MRKIEALTAIKGMAAIGITQINEQTIKDFFSKRSYIHTTGKEIKECLKEVGIKLKPCKDYIPLDYMPVGCEQKEVRKKSYSTKIGTSLTKAEIKNLYIKQDLSIQQIMELKNCSSNTIYSKLRTYKIAIKKTALQKKLHENLNKIILMHSVDKMRYGDIGKIYGCTADAISMMLISNGYNVRPRIKTNNTLGGIINE